jgi:SAM-dependent methyltransferase
MTNIGADAGQTRHFWEAHYQARPNVWSGRPNAVLVDVAAALPPGHAIDLGCGEGGDARWLAGHGWRVTAVDVSATALARAADLAASAGVADRIDFRCQDLAAGFPAGRFDLVSAHFLQSPVAFPRERVLHAAAGAVAPGGLLLVVEHASVPPWSAHRHGDVVFPTPEDTLAALGLGPAPERRWRTERLGIFERQATGPDGQRATVADNVIALTRLP